MRRSGLGRNRRSSQAGEVMGVAAADVFATLFSLMLVVIALKATDLLLAADPVAEPATTPIDVFVSPASVRVGDESPISIENLASRLRALGDNKSAVRIHVEATVAIEREHAILAAAMTAGVGAVSLSISGGEVR
jgi:biopolymer transport protein ExbD